MAKTKRISQLTAASALSGSEFVPVVQNGSTKRTTVQQIAALGGGSGGGGGLGSVTILSDASVGGPVSLPVNFNLNIPAFTDGITEAPIVVTPGISLTGQGGYGGGPFEATTVTFPDLTFVGDFQITNTNTLETLSAPELVRAKNGISVYSHSALTTATFPKLEYVQYLNLGSTPNLVGLTFPSLTKMESVGLNGADFGGTGYNAAMFPVLEEAGLNWGYYTQSSFEINLPSLKTLKNLSGGNSIVSSWTIDLPNVITLSNNNLYLNNLNTLTRAIIGTPGVTKVWGVGSNSAYVYANGSALDQASVDNFLKVIASLDGTNGTTAVNGGQIFLQGGSNAVPSAEGLAAKNVLLSRNFYIAHNN